MKHMELLGLRVKDKVTGFSGVVTSIAYDLYGCVQAVVTPPVGDKSDVPDGRWFDASRLNVLHDKPVMEAPDFNQVKGPAEKPPFREWPR